MKKNKERNNKVSISIISVFVFIFIGVTNMNAVGFLGFGNTASWKEEVLLHDGSKIIVERWQKRGVSREIGQRPDISDQSITFTIPGTKKIVSWKDEYSKEIAGSNFTLLALHILNSTPYIITTPHLCLSYNKWGRPNPPYVIFKFESNKWKRIGLTMLPLDFKNINLVVDTLNDEEKLVRQKLVSAEMVKELNGILTQVEFKTIARTPLKGVGCENLVTDGKGTWMGIDWFKDQPSYEACLNVCNRERFSAEYCPCSRLFNTTTKEK